MIDICFRHPDRTTQRVRKVSPVQSRRGAEACERELRALLLAGKYNEDSPVEEEKRQVPTVDEFHEEFLSVYAEVNNKPSEVHTKRRFLAKHLLPVFGELKLDDIRPRDIEGYKRKKQKEGYKPKTINNHLGVLRRLLTIAIEWEVIAHAPKIRALRVGEQPFDFLSFTEAEMLCASAFREWRSMIVLALRTGLRLGELRALRWTDVDLKAGRIVVRQAAWESIIGVPKNGRSREVPLSDDAVLVLRSHRRRSFLVFSDQEGELLSVATCVWGLRKCCRQAGLRRLGWHALRHSFASHLAMRGVPMKTVQELLGHQSFAMTMRYAHLSPDVRRDAVRVLDLQANGTIAAPPGGAFGT